ncbi:MAG: CPBP family intramembrane metalloprotease [bacterium]|nr:CPBP family intramembrane metalloprotease [bacterium]
MKNESYPFIFFWELCLVLLGWCFLNFRLMDYLVKFSGSYILVSALLSSSIIVWLMRSKDYRPKLLVLDREYLPYLAICVVVALILIPTGFMVGIITLNLNWFRILAIPAAFIGVYLSIGLVEELVFRQVMLVFLEQRWGAALALGGSSLLFGLSHIVRGAFPNWSYVLLATLAGLLYGAIFRRAGLGYAILLHSIVDVIKYAFLSR